MFIPFLKKGNCANYSTTSPNALILVGLIFSVNACAENLSVPMKERNLSHTRAVERYIYKPEILRIQTRETMYNPLKPTQAASWWNLLFNLHPHPHKKPQHHGGGGGGSGSGNGNNGGDKSSHAENTTAFDTDDSSGDDDADSKPLSNDFKNFGFDDKSNENSSGQKDNEPLQISPTLIGGAMVATLAVMTAAASMMVQIRHGVRSHPLTGIIKRRFMTNQNMDLASVDTDNQEPQFVAIETTRRGESYVPPIV